MISFLQKLFARSGTVSEDEILGCDMAPAPSVLATLCDPLLDGTVLQPSSSAGVGPFTTMAQAPIRES